MSISLNEFRHTLSQWQTENRWRQADQKFTVTCDSGQAVVITLVPLPPFNMGALSLPRHCVEFRFGSMSREQQQIFLTQFDRAYQRGGG